MKTSKSRIHSPLYASTARSRSPLSCFTRPSTRSSRPAGHCQWTRHRHHATALSRPFHHWQRNKAWTMPLVRSWAHCSPVSIVTICHHIPTVSQWRIARRRLKIWRRPCRKCATLSAVLITGTCVIEQKPQCVILLLVIFLFCTSRPPHWPCNRALFHIRL